MSDKAIVVGLPGADAEVELAAPRAPFLKSLQKWVRDQPLGAVSALGVNLIIVMAVFAS